MAESENNILTKIVILSGKGGVGKSTVAANLAVQLALAGRQVGLMDIDLHGPSIPKLLGLEKHRLGVENDRMVPAKIGDNLKVMSIGFMLKSPDDPVVWRGPLKMRAIKQFVEDVNWGSLDCLVVDCPPGTGDEPLSIAQLLEEVDGAIVVTTPQELSVIDVRKSINFSHKLNMPVLGVVENMSGFVCPHCGHTVDIFSRGGGRKMAEEMGVPFLGAIPIDPSIVEAGDKGEPYLYHYAKSKTAEALSVIAGPVLSLIDGKMAAVEEEKQG